LQANNDNLALWAWPGLAFKGPKRRQSKQVLPVQLKKVGREEGKLVAT